VSCFAPIRGFWSEKPNANGKHVLVFNPKDALGSGHPFFAVEVPCGYCVGCRIDRARAWALRCVHESESHDLNCFVTLTYSVAPAHGSLVKKDVQDFWKRLRKHIAPAKLRYFMCGEYGTHGDRPHYHACIFGWRPADLLRVSETIYGSEALAKIWGHGYVTVGDVTHASAAYVAQYVLKKQYGKDVDAYYGDRLPEYVAMSRRPGIGTDWIVRHFGDVYGFHDAVNVDGRMARVPRFYDDFYDSLDPAAMAALKVKRLRAMMDYDKAEREGSRQLVKNEVAKRRVALAQDRRTFE